MGGFLTDISKCSEGGGIKQNKKFKGTSATKRFAKNFQVWVPQDNFE